MLSSFPLFPSDQHTDGVALIKHSAVKIGGVVISLSVIAENHAALPITNGNISVVMVLIDRNKASLRNL
jgi:hypothetical protein